MEANVPGPDDLLSLPALAYVGPGAGWELIPYALGLLGWVGVALAAVLLAPVSALVRRIRTARTGSPDATGGRAGPDKPAGVSR
jgi:hypothetical protein